MRLFIAIQIPQDLRQEIALWMKALAQLIPDPKGRLHWVKENQLHLTLKFLGETREDQVQPLRQALKAVAAVHAGFSMRLTKVGHFGGRVVWLGIETGTKETAALAGSIEDGCQMLGFVRESRAFNPHITLARSKFNPGTLRLADLPHPITQKIFGPFTVFEVGLIQSTLTPQGAIYKTLEKFPFARVT